jgi:hypothetical protein
LISSLVVVLLVVAHFSSGVLFIYTNFSAFQAFSALEARPQLSRVLPLFLRHFRFAARTRKASPLAFLRISNFSCSHFCLRQRPSYHFFHFFHFLMFCLLNIYGACAKLILPEGSTRHPPSPVYFLFNRISVWTPTESTMGRFKKWIIGAVVFFVLFTIVGFFVIPPLVKPYLLETLSKTLNRQVSLSDISLNPYTLTVTLRGFEIKEPKGEKAFVSFDELVVNLDIRSIFKRAPVIENLPSAAPCSPRPEQGQDVQLLRSACVDEGRAEGREEGARLFAVNNIIIENGSIDFIDGPLTRPHGPGDEHRDSLYIQHPGVHRHIRAAPVCRSDQRRSLFPRGQNQDFQGHPRYDFQHLDRGL